jgi:hypothetical protein
LSTPLLALCQKITRAVDTREPAGAMR